MSTTRRIAPAPAPQEVAVGALALGELEGIALDDDLAAAWQGLRWASGTMRGRVLWSVNSTARGGGVAEMLPSLLGYAPGRRDRRALDGRRRDARVLRDHEAAAPPAARVRRRRGTAGRRRAERLRGGAAQQRVRAGRRRAAGRRRPAARPPDRGG